MMFFRSGFIGYYDLYGDSGTRHFAGQRLGCWINAIPGNGLVMIPEASAGCVCLFSIASTVVMEPKSESKSWGILSAVGPATPVERIGVNLGAPGDRKDIHGKEWFGFPRPRTRERLEFTFDIQPQLLDGGGWYSKNSESVAIDKTDVPWLFTSGGRGLSQFEIPLRDQADGPATYKVRLYFAELATQPVGACSVKLQGEIAEENLEVSKLASFVNEAVVKEYSGVQVDRNLVVEILPLTEELPTLAAVEVIRE
jgi:hypothetical protein